MNQKCKIITLSEMGTAATDSEGSGLKELIQLNKQGLGLNRDPDLRHFCSIED